MGKEPRQRKDSQHEQDDALPQQPAWRQRKPSQPRKQIKRKQSTAPDARRGTGRGGKIGRPALVLPSRESWAVAGRVGLLLLTAIVTTAGLIYMLQMPVLTVGRSSTQIGGNQRITPEDVYSGSGIDGRNVLLLRSSEIAARVKAVPGVASVAVHIRLPNQVLIDVTEHAPLVAWQSSTGTVWLAADGAEVPQAGAAPPLTFIDQSNGRLARDAALSKLILQNLGAVRAARPELAEFYYAEEPGLYFRTPEGWDVWLGESGSMEEKLALAEAAAKDIAQQGARPKRIDVRQSGRRAIGWES